MIHRICRGISNQWLVASAICCLSLLRVPSASAADKPAGPPPAAMEQVKSLSDQMRTTVSDFADGLAREYVGVLVRADQEFDAQKIIKPEHRFFLVEKASYDFIDSTLVQYDAFAADVNKGWKSTPAAFRVGIRNLLDLERARLEAFLREDPVIIRSVIKPMVAKGTLQYISTAAIMQEARDAGEKADAGAGFTNKLRRAARVGDAELRRVMLLKARKTGADLTDVMADNYVKFLLKANQALDKSGIKDTVVRAYSMAEGNHLITTKMLEEYDRFAAAMTKSFKGSGKIIETAVADAVAAERARIDSFIHTDPTDLRTAYTLPRGKTIEGAELRRQMELAAQIKAEEKAGFRRFK